jgi:hypothetical protein
MAKGGKIVWSANELQKFNVLEGFLKEEGPSSTFGAFGRA